MQITTAWYRRTCNQYQTLPSAHEIKAKTTQSLFQSVPGTCCVLVDLGFLQVAELELVLSFVCTKTALCLG